MTSLQKILQQSALNFYMPVVDPSLSISLPELSNFETLTLPRLKIKNSGTLLSQKKIQDHISTSPRPFIVPFKVSAKIEHLCRRHHWGLAANPAKINRLLEDKIKFYRLAKKNNLPLIPSSIGKFNQKNFLQAQKKYGVPLVLQSHFGWAGNSTYLAYSYSQAKSQIPLGLKVKFSPYLPGISLLNNACLTRFGLLQSPPALQYTGLPQFTDNPFATVGRQWPDLMPPKVNETVQKITSDFAQKILRPLNYKGFFGLDFLYFQNQLYLLECNPRLTASYAFYTYLELKAGLTPLFYYHLAEFARLSYPLNLTREQKRFYHPRIVGSQLTPRNRQGTIIKKIETSRALVKSLTNLNLSSKIF